VSRSRREELTRFWNERIPFNRLCGITITDWDPGRVRMEVDPTDDLSNGVGSVHGGVVAAIIDTAANAAAIPIDDFARGSTAATVSMTVNYVVPARGRLAASAACVKPHGAMRSVAVDVHDATGTLVAHGLVTVRVSVAATRDPR
jgi:uncharacterized protein (TIGR00369 family)